MKISQVGKSWNYLGQEDPLWAILTVPDKRGNKWEPEEFFRSGQTEVERVFDCLRSKGSLPSGRRALDFGCGVGRLSQALAPHFDEVRGVDIAPSMIGQANRYNKYPNRCRYHLSSEADLRFLEDGYFDFVISLIVLQHIPSRYSMNYLREFIRVLSPGGLLVFQLPSQPVPERRRRERLRRIVPVTALGLYLFARYRDSMPRLIEMHPVRQAAVLSTLSNAGGEVIDVREDGRAGGFVSLQYCVRKKTQV